MIIGFVEKREKEKIGKEMIVLPALIGISALPVIAAFFWFRSKGFALPNHWFLLSLLAGAVSLLLAALAQFFIAYAPNSSVRGLFFNVFVRIALTEEGGKLIALLILFKIGEKYADSHKIASGLIAGLGFALIESASYGASDLRIALFRAFTAAPLHAACGARAGSAAVLMRENGKRAVFRFLSAVAIHGTYNILVVSPGNVRFLSILLSFSSLFSAVQLILMQKKEEEN